MASFLKKEKQYGLIIPNRKGAAKPVARPSAFGDSSSEEVSKLIEHNMARAKHAGCFAGK